MAINEIHIVPASGYRGPADGKLYASGTHGFSWSSTPNGSSFAWSLDFLSGSVLVYSNFNFSYGFPVRCVQASVTTVFAFTNDTFVFFPVSGKRGYLDGKLYSLGLSGYGWSSTPNGSSAWSLDVWSSGAHMLYDIRGYGFPVRCVQASVTTVFAFTNDTFVFFPAAGYRSPDAGKLINSGTWGYEWASTLGASGVWGLNFSPAGLGLWDFGRGCGFPVRCVQASAAVFVFVRKDIKEAFVFFPASGFRSYVDGKLVSSGTGGYGWTSTPNGSDAWGLYFYSGGAYMGNGYRGFSFPVRCVQASAAVWAVQKENIKQIRFRRESGKVRLCRRGRADSVTHLGRKLSVRYSLLSCAAPSYLFTLIKLPVFECLYFYKHFSGYSLFFPASGCRSYNDGRLVNLGSSGYGWTSTPTDSGSAADLTVRSSTVCLYYDSRSYGFSVRCVQASATVFALTKDTFIFFPASGYRYYADGSLVALGAGGLAWSSTPGDGYAWRLSFDSGGAHMDFNYLGRAYGFSVRCVQASATVWAVQKENIRQIRFRREFGKEYLYRRGRADSVIHLGRKLSVRYSLLSCAAPSYLFTLIKLPVFECLYFYKHSSDYFLFFPASGYRNFTDGKLSGLGASGYGWTSSSADGVASSLLLYSAAASMYDYVRNDGFSVRCVQASAAVIVFIRKDIEETFFFPATGCRVYNDGSLHVSGAWGYGWTSTLSGSSYAWFLSFSSRLPYLYYDYRGSGFPVRCVQASAVVFVFFPAAGYRNVYDGVLQASGGWGDTWSSTTDGSSQALFLCSYSGLVKMSTDNRGFGMSVRCVQASATVWAVQKENIKQIRFRRESGKVRLYRRGRADSVTRLRRKLSVGHSLLPCAAPSYLFTLIKLPVLNGLYFYKHCSGYSLFFPATGNRDGSGGGLTASGLWGLFWTATPSDGRVWAMEFNAAAVVMYGDMREHGFSVRCVQASAVVFVFIRKDIEETFFFAASGYRDLNDGKPYYSATHGFNWTSTSNGSHAYYLMLNSVTACMVSNYRHYGLSVRCVQASAFVFVFVRKDVKDTLGFIPASWLRNGNTGELYLSGPLGYGWSSTSGDVGAYSLCFWSGNVFVDGNSCTVGMSVRCVQASATVWAIQKENIKQIRFRWESGKVHLCRRGRADSVTRLGRKLSVGHSLLSCAAPSYLFALIKLPVFECLYFYKHSSGYSLFFPASGYHDPSTGVLYLLGSFGLGWTSTPDGSSNVWNCYIYSGNAFMGSVSRAFGLSVRCVQASATVFVYVRKDIEKTFVFFPASGYRNINDGWLSSSGIWGYGWTSTLDSGNVWHLDIHSGNAYMLSYGRGFGFPVRCVQASAAVFVFVRKDIEKTFVFFPASGYRDSVDGRLNSLGVGGNGWTSSTGDDGFYLRFQSGLARVQSASRAYGLSVRCVQASAAVWAVQKENIKQIRYRRESGKARLCRRGHADSVTRLGHKLSVRHSLLPCAAPSYSISLVKLPVLNGLYFYKHSSGYSLFFPATGYRHWSLGVLFDSGTHGYGWTSTVLDGGNVGRLDFWSTQALVDFTLRGIGHAVRCVQASASVLAFVRKDIEATFIFFPAAGYRNVYDGVLHASGGLGDTWSSTTDGNSQALFLCSYSGLVKMSTDNRGFGMSVRCVQASVAVFVYVRKDIEKTFVFFPAAGYRDIVDGKLYKSGGEGDGWASPSTGGSASFLRFQSGIAHVQSAARAFGLSVRCVQASATVWAFQKENIRQIRFRRESGKARLCRRGRADSVTRLGRKLSVGYSLLPCAAPSYSISLIELPVLNGLYFYKYSSGYFFFFPASGFREYSDGSLRAWGVESTGWSSTPEGANACRLLCGSGYASVYGIHRDYGFPVRCVQASAAVFAFTKDTFCFFPASGYRHYGSGKLGDSGSWGFGWSSTTDGSSHTWGLNFGSGYVSMYNYVCGYGFPVRCVQASATVWAVQKENIKQIRYRRESGKARLCRRGHADSVTRLGRKLSVGHSLLSCATPSYSISLIELPVLNSLYFYKYSSGYFLFFPAAGYRFASDGSLRALGTWGYGWSSTPNGGVAEFLWLSPGTTIMSGDIRSHGFSVRCVQASVAVFVFIREDFRETSVFFPASGNRGPDDGVLYSVGAGGYAWSSTAGDSGTAWDLNFYSGPGTMYPNNRTYGFPVRCVQASAAVFVFVRKDIEKTFVFFPASGYRHYSLGFLGDSGTHGYEWTSLTSNSNAWFLDVWSTNAQVRSANRDFGFSVRCVQASAAVFVFIRKDFRETSVFFPASGHRQYSVGSLDGSGTGAYAWSSTPGDSSTAWDLNSYSGPGAMYPNNRTYGFPVRCVQASAAVFAFVREDFKETSVFFPASGYRHLSDGTLVNSSTWGYGWTSTPNDGNAWYLNVYSGGALVYANFRTYGFPVRCVQASATVWIYQEKGLKQIRYRRESGKGILYRRGQADSVTRLGRKLSARHSLLPCAVPSYSISLIELPVLNSLYFYKYSSGYFLFFPAAGYRSHINGSLVLLGSSGYAWTSSVNSGNAWDLDVSSGGAFTNSHERANSFSVRCVQASAAVFVFIRKDIKETLFFFPATGHRNSGDGKLYGSGMWGYEWTDTQNGGNAWHLGFHSGGVDMGSNHRGYGFPVRCVQVSATVWAVQKQNIKQIRSRRESGKACLCRRGHADSVTRLGRKLSSGNACLPGAAPSHVSTLIRILVFIRLCFYEHSRGYSLFFPAAGYRDSVDGRLNSSGAEGNGWASSSTEGNGFYLRFMASLAHVNTTQRAAGLPVRCVQASATVFASYRKYRCKNKCR